LTHLDLNLAFARLNRRYFGGSLPPHNIRYSSRLQATGGQIDVQQRHIEISAHHTNRHGLLGALLHEMAHAWDHMQRGHTAHDKHFKGLLEKLGAARYAILRPRYVYKCPVCGSKYYRYRRINERLYSCSTCSPHRYDRRYQLKFEGELDPQDQEWLQEANAE